MRVAVPRAADAQSGAGPGRGRASPASRSRVVSSERQAQEGAIDCQLEALDRCIRDDGMDCDPEQRFVDDGVSGTVLLRPWLEWPRDQAAAGAFDRLYVHDPDRFSRKHAYQVLILEELARCGVEVAFLCNPHRDDPAENLLVQGTIAEHARANIPFERRSPVGFTGPIKTSPMVPDVGRGAGGCRGNSPACPG